MANECLTIENGNHFSYSRVVCDFLSSKNRKAQSEQGELERDHALHWIIMIMKLESTMKDKRSNQTKHLMLARKILCCVEQARDKKLTTG